MEGSTIGQILYGSTTTTEAIRRAIGSERTCPLGSDAILFPLVPLIGVLRVKIVLKSACQASELSDCK